ncbi:30S ribosomal protein S7 [Candidatus Peregrinibacteria bacterium CG22_combo_CG10-13_8_21_14_all_44_10]|nr:MAG: 30S ribosomal protein S7 [Candidatus Peregrinibacteria bacterium CG2_30_44_17]PIP66045.1 MAG: 30S ribosomal protein S7 [Candidatus Peregrinibacteria bacterium CG22_combo_CG10-13_8_21_14_all_44_10]PIS04114.1 MAG: 30S ribosomal protein S7 [Candidatus Peregrinibacteria bacterium CG10_big_fil_rev_8_21_14_0_10_44_7]PIX80061.1 MAG: 30S ribosomal protein S7 [Candidatus Peregrinibacteria bacterium CG_4_10_14_3_um_filter_44_21]PJB88848.1 MAG: 30S ribosomal protein S7 [Candidatus Peregrinibacteri
MQRTTTYIPEGSTLLQEKFINYIMQSGKKTVARKIFADTMEEIKKKGSKDPEQVFERAIDNVKPSMEVRPKRIGGGIYQIPIEVKTGRQLMLAFRWILGAARDKKGSKMAVKLSQELLDAANQTGTAMKKKEDTHKMAAANKAFAHYARY